MTDQQTYTRKTYNVNNPTNFPISVMGRISQDVELRYTPAGVAVVNLNLAISRRYPDSTGEWKEEVTFIKFSVWREGAERASKSLHKGDVVMVSFNPSSMQANAYAGQDGTPKASLQARAVGYHKVASSIEFGTNGEASEAEPAPAEEEIPF